MKHDVLFPKRGTSRLSGFQRSPSVMPSMTIGIASQLTIGEINIHEAKAKMDIARVELLQVQSRLTFPLNFGR